MTAATMTSAFESPAAVAPVFPGGVVGAPRALLRIEGALVLLGALAAYAHLGAGWGTFAMLFLAPDLAFLGYLAGPRVGAVAYNATHSYLGAGLVAAASFALGMPALLPYAIVWAGHVGFDRMLGYGLKYGGAFGFTHLGRVGKDA